MSIDHDAWVRFSLPGSPQPHSSQLCPLDDSPILDLIETVFKPLDIFIFWLKGDLLDHKGLTTGYSLSANR